jgi:hypothetical protein
MIPGNPVNPVNHVESGSCGAALLKGTVGSRLPAAFHRRDMAESEPHFATGGVGGAQGKLGPVSTSCPETEPLVFCEASLAEMRVMVAAASTRAATGTTRAATKRILNPLQKSNTNATNADECRRMQTNATSSPCREGLVKRVAQAFQPAKSREKRPETQAGKPLPFNGFCPLQRGFPTYFSLAFVPSFAEAGREARLKPALF